MRPVKNALVRPVAAELAAQQEAVGELVFERRGHFLQHLVDAAEQPLVVEPLVADDERRRRDHLVARVDADALQRERIVALFTSLVT